MDYPKSIPGLGLVDGHFVDENPTTGQIGSLIPAAWGDAVTQEILNVIKAAGMAPSESNVSQLSAAVLAIAASDFKRSVLVATTGPIALGGLQNIDGVAVPAGGRVLVKNQANAAQNWIYVASVGAWTRAQDADDSAECTPGHLIGVQAGAAGAGAVWQLTNTAVPVLGSTALNFVQVLGRTGVVAGEYRKVLVDALGRVVAGSNPDTLAGYGITDAATKAELSGKADKATTLAGYGITDTYTIPQTNSQINTRILRDSITAAGLANNDPSLPFMLRESDGKPYFLQPHLGFTPADKPSTDASLAQCIKLGQSVPARSNPKFNSNESGPIAYLSTGSGTVEVNNNGVTNASAVMAFNRFGAFAAYLGLDTDNQFKVGGWSMGNNAYVLWHAGNLNPGLYVQNSQLPRNTSGAGWWRCADTGIIRQWVQIPIGDIVDNNMTKSVTWPIQFPSQCSSIVATWSSAGTDRLSGIYAVKSKSASGAVFRFWEFESAVQAADLMLNVEAVGF